MGTDDQDQFGKGDGDVSVDHFDEKIVEAAKPTSNDVDKPGAGEVDSDDDHFSTCFAELEEAGDIAELEGDIAELEEAGLLPDTNPEMSKLVPTGLDVNAGEEVLVAAELLDDDLGNETDPDGEDEAFVTPTKRNKPAVDAETQRKEKLTLLTKYLAEDVAAKLLDDLNDMDDEGPLVITQRGRPLGPGQSYSNSPLETRTRRGVAGGLKSNRVRANQTRLKVEHCPKTLAEIAVVARELIKKTEDGHYEYGSISAVKKAMPELRLATSTIKRCYEGDLAEMGKGKRLRALGAGRKLACSDAVFGVGAWHEIMVNKGLYCTDHEIFLEFWEHLKQKVEVLESLKHEELTEKQMTSLKEMKSRLKQFDNADCRRIWRGRLCKTLGLGKFSVQKFTDLTPKQQEERILAHWQHFDWISSVIKWCILGIIQGLVADPAVFINNSEDTDIVLWDQAESF